MFFVQMIGEVILKPSGRIEDELVWNANVSLRTHGLVGMTPPILVGGHAASITSDPVTIRVR
jgi:hypothetical protein